MSEIFLKGPKRDYRFPFLSFASFNTMVIKFGMSGIKITNGGPGLNCCQGQEIFLSRNVQIVPLAHTASYIVVTRYVFRRGKATGVREFCH